MRIKELKRIVDKRDITFDYSASAGSVLSVESSSISLEKKEIVEAQTISLTNITLSGNQTLNGHTTVDGTTVLVNGQTDPKDNGLYYSNSSTWSRIPDDLNDLKLIKITAGEYNTTIWTLQNEPIEIDVDNINYVKIYEYGGLNYLQATLTFDETDLVNGKTIFQEIIPGLVNNIIDVISCYVKITTSSANTTGGYNVIYENGLGSLFFIREAYLQGTGTTYAKLFEGAYSTDATSFASGDGLGLYDPSFVYTSGTIDGTIYLTYRYIAV